MNVSLGAEFSHIRLNRHWHLNFSRSSTSYFHFSSQDTMYLSTFLSLPVFLLSLLSTLATALPTHSPSQPARATSLTKRDYSAAFFSRLKTQYRATSLVAPACAGIDCPIYTPEEEICNEFRLLRSERIRFPNNVTGTEAIEVELCRFYAPVDERCAQYGVSETLIYGGVPGDLESDMAMYGFTGCPATPENLVRKMVVQLQEASTGWDENKTREMLDLVAPGWDETDGNAVEFTPLQRGLYVDQRSNPFNLPPEIMVRVLPEGPVHEPVLECAAWEFARRGENCTSFARRAGMAKGDFLKLNYQMADKKALAEGRWECGKPLLAGYSTLFLHRLNRIYRVSALSAPGCSGCPERTPVQKVCFDNRHAQSETLIFPPDPLRTNLSDTDKARVPLTRWYPPVDIKCMEYGASWEDVFGMSSYDVEKEMENFGWAGFPATPEQLVQKVMFHQKDWSDEKVGRMLDIVAPGWTETGKDVEHVKPVTEEGKVYVDDRENPFHLPGGTRIRMLANSAFQ
ncbi:hypothetical protein BJ508DRAFT_360889 [Ascobolus immersus RN42]|uniref:Uncharacterized protein n=1 Tax=Ascobolus immersus RN42 TaxID=1160509 RepID=A0A3N4IE47_ASCIM|nr:hypothetical protein BJ508DRAFT_360889 [Ascobolus immersus RN42]